MGFQSSQTKLNRRTFSRKIVQSFEILSEIERSKIKISMLRFLLTGFLFTFFHLLLTAQLTPPPATPAQARLDGMDQRKQLAAPGIIDAIEFKNIGPTVQSGRVVDLEVNPDNPTEFYVAYASGGLWKTTNNGMTFSPMFQNEVVMTIGDIAVDWKRNTIWLGSGEVNSSRSSYAGTGMYKSTDGGTNWTYIGLPESHHIGRVILHPKNPNTAWVAVLGHLYSSNPERGVYKTTDGGKNWEKTLYVDENTGAVDMVIDPDDPNTLYAATWTRERRAWDFVEAGSGSAIYKSTNGGKSWKAISGKNTGFPMDEGTGRIGLDIGKDEKGKIVLYAALDNYNRRPKEAPEEETLTKTQLREMTREDFDQIKDYLLDDFLRGNQFPRKFNARTIKKMIRDNELTIEGLVAYTEDANSLLFDTPVIGLEIYRSDDEGRSWNKTHDDYIDFVYNSYGYYFGQIRVNPSDINKIYVLGVPVIRSDDGGKTFKSIGSSNVHADHHALWINPKDPDHLILGNDGGANISYDDGTTWNNCNAPSVGQFYAIAVDMAEPYKVYGGLQDNGVWVGPSNYQYSPGWMASGQYPYEEILGGDGMQVAIDTRDNNTVYTGFQFGNYFRIDMSSGRRKSITPKHELGDRPLRWNWQTPIHLSVHNQDILYMGSNKLHRTFNKGDDFSEISDDLTQGGIKGDVAFGTLATIHESPLRFGLLYTGSDDGLVHVSRDGGYNWQKIMKDLPENLWVSRIQASAFAEGRVYLSLNGYRWDDFTPYLYVSEDYGQNWQAIGKDLPPEPINVIKEDPKNENILYVGTDNGLYISLDRGQSFLYMDNNLPAVAVHDLVVHPRENELILGTHGRSLYLADVSQLQQLTAELMAGELHVFKFDAPRYSSRWGRTAWWGSSEPQLEIPVYTKTDGKAMITIKTTGDDPLTLKSYDVDLNTGLNYLSYDLTVDPDQLDAYKALLNKNVKADEKPISVKKADNDQLYIHSGKYILEIKKGETVVKKELEIR